MIIALCSDVSLTSLVFTYRFPFYLTTQHTHCITYNLYMASRDGKQGSEINRKKRNYSKELRTIDTVKSIDGSTNSSDVCKLGNR